MFCLVFFKHDISDSEANIHGIKRLNTYMYDMPIHGNWTSILSAISSISVCPSCPVIANVCNRFHSINTPIWIMWLQLYMASLFWWHHYFDGWNSFIWFIVPIAKSVFHVCVIHLRLFKPYQGWNNLSQLWVSIFHLGHLVECFWRYVLPIHFTLRRSTSWPCNQNQGFLPMYKV